ncbi:MAG: HNH endonuclease [Alphaproteobacteria bacterium]|nr:HNH endonuclease [Alphaproteobacteria bacterium]
MWRKFRCSAHDRNRRDGWYPTFESDGDYRRTIGIGNIHMRLPCGLGGGSKPHTGGDIKNAQPGKPARPAPVAPPAPRWAPEDRRHIPMGLRFQVLQRDDFRCTACGDSPALTRGVKLHVDHIEPWSLGGKSLAENLRTLCAQCNFGKGAKRPKARPPPASS